MTVEQSARRHLPQPAHDHTAGLQDALDFVNTLEFSREGKQEHLPDFISAVEWFNRHDLLHLDMIEDELRRHADGHHPTEPELRRVRRVRAALRELLDANADGRKADPAALAEVNRALRTHYIYELVPADDGVSLGHRHEGDPIDGALARLAEAIARELIKPEADRLKVCDNQACRYVFHDSSPSGRRRWCDMATCGNRAKVARHRARQRGQSEAEL